MDARSSETALARACHCTSTLHGNHAVNRPSGLTRKLVQASPTRRIVLGSCSCQPLTGSVGTPSHIMPPVGIGLQHGSLVPFTLTLPLHSSAPALIMPVKKMSQPTAPPTIAASALTKSMGELGLNVCAIGL